MQKRTLKPATAQGIYFWNMAGSVCNAANTVLMTLLITRLCGAAAAGVYSMALAVAQLVGPVGLFEIRNFQVSDAKKEYSFSEYYTARLFSLGAALIFIGAWVLVKGYTGEKLVVILCCCAFKLIDCLEDVYQGLLQVHERLDIVGKSFALRIIADAVLFAVLLFLWNNLIVALVAYTLFAAVWVMAVTVPAANHFARPKWQASPRIFHLFTVCVPLFLTSFLMSYIISAPKYAIDVSLSAEMQTYFSVLFMPAAVVNLFTIILYRLYMTRMAEDWVRGRLSDFLRQVFLLLAWIALLGAGVLCGAWLLGIPVLKLIYGLEELTPYRPELMLIILGGIFSAAAGWFNVVLTIMRRQKSLLFINAAAAMLMWLTAKPLVATNGLRGAAQSYLYTMLLLVVLQSAYMLRVWLCMKNNANKKGIQEPEDPNEGRKQK
ncbi:lipopolysaccharide biosynthesis protein [Pygmaiobacter massiliensis]|uniref:lipopolysaccharide biosynthesis protein n=1 Tax=Pygmaiobacter massiliensis TaxID=1917873 RepID=UPI0028A240DF|nr:lipopolysaccharide biosynthesis protein [Pygmaiobacter massiliensis]